MANETEELAPKALKNSLFTLGAFVWPILLSFFATPFIVRGLGNENYGILALVTSFVGFFGFLDFGISPSLVKYTAQYHATKEFDKLNKFFSSALFFYSLIGLFAAGAISLFAVTIAPDVIKVSPGNEHTLQTVLFVAAIGFLINMILTAFSAIPGALQRFDIASFVNVFITTLSTGLTVLLVALGKGVVSLAVLAVSTSALAIIVYVRINSRLIPHLKFVPRPDSEAVKKMFAFGTFAVITSLSSVALFQLDKFILAGRLGTAMVTYYVVPGNLAIKIHGLVSATTTVVFPLSSALLASQNLEKLQRLYERSTRLILIFLVVTITPIYMLAFQFLHYWIGQNFAENSTVALQLLVATYTVLALTAIPFYILYGAGKPKLAALNSTMCAVLNIVLIFVLIPTMGINGAALAYLISVIPGAILFMGYVEKRIVKVESLKFYSTFLPKLAMLIAIGLGLAALMSGLISSLGSFIAVYLAVVAVSALAAIVFKVAGQEDVDLVKNLIVRKTAGLVKGN